MLKNANVKKCWEILKNVKQDEQDTEFLPYFPLICFPYFIIHFIPYFPIPFSHSPYLPTEQALPSANVLA